MGRSRWPVHSATCSAAAARTGLPCFACGLSVASAGAHTSRMSGSQCQVVSARCAADPTAISAQAWCPTLHLCPSVWLQLEAALTSPFLGLSRGDVGSSQGAPFPQHSPTLEKGARPALQRAHNVRGWPEEGTPPCSSPSSGFLQQLPRQSQRASKGLPLCSSRRGVTPALLGPTRPAPATHRVQKNGCRDGPCAVLLSPGEGPR